MGSQWVVRVQQSLQEPPDSDGSHVTYQRVPESLKIQNTRMCYIPQVISFGAYHFQKKDPLLDEIEVLKSEVARKHNNLWNGLVVAVVQNFMNEGTQEKIRKIYGKEFPANTDPDELSWMMVRDGCFLLEILIRFSEIDKGESNGQQIPDDIVTDMGDESIVPITDSILGIERYHPLLNDIVKDMFKMENQLPLWVVDEIFPGWPEWRKLIESALKNLSPIEVKNFYIYSKFNKQYHILYLLHEYIVDKPEDNPRLGRAPNFYKPYALLNIPDCRPSVLSILKVVAYAFIFVILSPVYFAWLIMFLTWGLYQTYITVKAGTEEHHIPTLEELQRLGVKLKKLEGQGIYHIHFDEKNCTLHMPQFKVDDRSEVLLRNLMALEIYHVEKPITRYALLMNDLVNTSADVAILRQYDILTSKLGSYEDVAQLWNSITVATEMPKCKPIDTAATQINSYCKKRWKVLWAQFKMLHCSKPWLVLSLLGGTSLLLLTIVQVACLFRNCQI